VFEVAHRGGENAWNLIQMTCNGLGRWGEAPEKQRIWHGVTDAMADKNRKAVATALDQQRSSSPYAELSLDELLVRRQYPDHPENH
jgi:hypothetical protein